MLAREDVPEEVTAAGAGKSLRFGPEYIIPNAFDPRLISARPRRGRQGGDGERRGAPADHRPAALCPQTCRAGWTRRPTRWS